MDYRLQQKRLREAARELNPDRVAEFKPGNNPMWVVMNVVDAKTGDKLYGSPDYVRYSHIEDIKRPEQLKQLLRKWRDGL